MRLGGPIFLKSPGPDEWALELQKQGYRAAFCPVKADAPREEIRAYAEAARSADIVIAEVGAWSNPLSPEKSESQAAIEYCQRQLMLADEIGAACCVNISGSRGRRWDGPDPMNFTQETFSMIVSTVRAIIDAVHPKRAFFTLEPMPWMYPDSPDHYLDLIRAIDRKRFGVHLDPVNMICSPQLYFSNAAFLRECFAKLGPHIKSCHAKDILLSDHLTTHLDEVRPGLGYLDYQTFLGELNKLPVDTPLMLEHLDSEEEYFLSAQYVRSVGQAINISV